MSASSAATLNAINSNSRSTQDNNSQPDQQKTAQVVIPVQTEAHSIQPSLRDHRPVTPSPFQIRDTVNILGIRPIASSDFQVSDTINILGIRPIASSEIKVDKTITTSGIRPIAANTIAKFEDLMGYID